MRRTVAQIRTDRERWRRSPMRTLDHLLEEAKRLPFEDRRRLIEQLEALDAPEEDTPEAQGAGDRYRHTLALAGTMHAEVTNVSSDKYQHLADIYADHHEKQ
jgi:hypothetical protein